MGRTLIGNVYPSDEYLRERCAPNGYGLGDQAQQTDNLDTAVLCGWYAFGDDCVGSPFEYGGVALTMNRYDTSKVQIAFNIVTADWGGAGGIARRICGETNWYEWEYINPPMMLGVEYKTVERWQGKAVYTKAVDCGELPNASSKIIAHGLSVIAMIRCSGVTQFGTTIPYRWNDNYLSVSADRTNIHLCTNTDFSEQTGIVQLWYTKD